MGFLKEIEVEPPHEPGNKLKLRELRHGELADATMAAQRNLMNSLARLGGAEKFAEMQREAELLKTARSDPADGGSSTAVVPKEAQPDIATVVELGLTGWSGPAYLDDDGQPVPCDSEHKANLDSETVEFAAEQILEMSRRPSSSGSESG